MRLRWRSVLVLVLACAWGVLAGCAADGAADTGSFVAVVPPASVVETHDTYVTLDAPAAVAVVAVVARPPDPGCVPDDVACLEAACLRGSGLGCEARGDLLREQEDENALAFYARALVAYRRACGDGGGDADACAATRRLSTPGYGAHTYLAMRPDCPDGYVVSPAGCALPSVTPGPVGTTVIVNGNHNVVQVFGSAAKVVGKAKKGEPRPD